MGCFHQLKDSMFYTLDDLTKFSKITTGKRDLKASHVSMIVNHSFCL